MKIIERDCCVFSGYVLNMKIIVVVVSKWLVLFLFVELLEFSFLLVIFGLFFYE